MSDFFRTRMGQRFYEATMPKIADQLERLNANIEALVAELRALRERRGTEASIEQPETESPNTRRSAEESELPCRRGIAVVRFEPSIAADVNDSDAGASKRWCHQETSVAACRILLGAEDCGPALAREYGKPLDPGLAVRSRCAARVVDGAIPAVELGAIRATTELAPEEDVLDRVVRERLRESSLRELGCPLRGFC
jgi:hypothetical protein